MIFDKKHSALSNGDHMGTNRISGFICNICGWGLMGRKRVSPLEMGIRGGVEGATPSRVQTVMAQPHANPEWIGMTVAKPTPTWDDPVRGKGRKNRVIGKPEVAQMSGGNSLMRYVQWSEPLK